MKKNYNLELIRVASFFFVILIHVTNYYCRAYDEISGGEYLFALTFNILARVSVPCFFMITGALLVGREDSLKKHGKRLLRFFIVLVVWTLIFYVWNRWVMHSHYNIKIVLFEPIEQHLWYMYAIIPIYMVMPFLQVLCKHLTKNQEKVFFVLITFAIIFNYVVSFFGQEPYYPLPIIGDRIYMYYVFVGYYLHKYWEKIFAFLRNSTVLLFAIFLGPIAISVLISELVSCYSDSFFNRLLEYQNPLLALSAAAFFLLLLQYKNGNYIPKGRFKGVIEAFCSCSFGIYLVHIIFLDTYKRTFDAADLTAYWAIPLVTVLVTLISFVVIYLLRLTKLGRKIT